GRKPVLERWRAIHNPVIYLHPSMREEWRGTITDHHARIHATFAQQPCGADCSLQAQHRLPVEARCQENSVANGLFQFVAGGFRGNGLPAYLPQRRPGAAPSQDHFVADDLIKRSQHEPCVFCLFHDAASRLIRAFSSSSSRKRTVWWRAVVEAIFKALLISAAIASRDRCRSIACQMCAPVPLQEKKWPLPRCKITIPSS